MKSNPRKIVIYQTSNGKAPFNQWFDNLKDRKAKAAIDLRIGRLSLGLFGDCKALQGGIYELRIRLGPGYRVYYGLEGDTLILLLLGGDKSTQSQDIEKAKAYWTDYRSDDDA